MKMNTFCFPGGNTNSAVITDYLINPVSIGVTVMLINIAKLIEREACEMS